MRILATLALLTLAACASARAPDAVVMQAPRPLTPSELALTAEGKILCRRPNNDGSCSSITTLALTPDGARIEGAGLETIESYIVRFDGLFGADAAINEADRQLLATLERHRATGGYDLIRTTLRYDADYDPDRRAFCTAPRPDALIFSNAEFALTRSRDSDRTSDWVVPPDMRAQIIELAERLFASSHASGAVGAQERTALRNSLRDSEPTCIVFYGIEVGSEPRVTSMSTASPDNMEWASVNRVRVDPHPIDAVLPLRVM